MDINYENIRKLVEKLPLDFSPGVINVDDVKIFIESQLSIVLNERGYKLQPDSSDIRKKSKAVGLPTFFNGKVVGGIILFYDGDSINEQRGYILHEISELELRVLGKSREESHKIAKQYESRYLREDESLNQNNMNPEI